LYAWKPAADESGRQLSGGYFQQMPLPGIAMAGTSIPAKAYRPHFNLSVCRGYVCTRSSGRDSCTSSGYCCYCCCCSVHRCTGNRTQRGEAKRRQPLKRVHLLEIATQHAIRGVDAQHRRHLSGGRMQCRSRSVTHRICRASMTAWGCMHRLVSGRSLGDAAEGGSVDRRGGRRRAAVRREPDGRDCYKNDAT